MRYQDTPTALLKICDMMSLCLFGCLFSSRRIDHLQRYLLNTWVFPNSTCCYPVYLIPTNGSTLSFLVGLLGNLLPILQCGNDLMGPQKHFQAFFNYY